MVHLFFNIIGILIFYPIPALRIPIPLARKLGDLTAEYRWFAGFYLLFMFFLIPALVFLLSLAGPAALYMVMGPLLLFVLVVAIINILQVWFNKNKRCCSQFSILILRKDSVRELNMHKLKKGLQREDFFLTYILSRTETTKL